jgi:hypothetical protein
MSMKKEDLEVSVKICITVLVMVVERGTNVGQEDFPTHEVVIAIRILGSVASVGRRRVKARRRDDKRLSEACLEQDWLGE